MNSKLLWSLLLLGGLSASLPGQATVSVHAGSVLNRVTDIPLGLNLNTLTDGSANRVYGARSLSAAVAESGARYLRFPGGEKSDVYAWAAPPYDDPSTAYLLRRSKEDWPSNDPDIWDLSAGHWANDNYDFDEFIADCRATDAEPVVVVAFDGMYLPAHDGGTALTREQALEMAVAWVHYANVTKGYNVKYWELGNETWNGTTYAGANPGFTTYGRDAAEFARAMKAVDPDILIGINGASYSDFKLALDECAAAVDFLDVHAYPAYGFERYTDYVGNNLNPGGIVDVAQAAIDAVADPTARDNLFIVMTETSATGFRLDSEWDRGNNLGQALANFDILAQSLQDDRLHFTQYWNSHWIRPDLGQSHPYDLFTGTNKLNASGKMMALLTDELLDEMVQTTSDGVVRTFATTDRSRGRLTVFLLNKDTESTPANLTVEGFAAAAGVERAVFTGATPQSTGVDFTTASPASVRDGQVSLTLPPASLTVLRFVAPATAGDYWLEAECAAVGSRWTIAATSSASGGKYAVGPAENAMHMVPADLEANRVRFLIPAASAGNHKLFVRINAPSNSADSYWVRLNDGAWYKWNSRIIQSKGFQWNQFPVELFLMAGENTIDFAFREQGTQLDKIYLTRGDTPPAGSGLADSNCTDGGSIVPVLAAEAECPTDFSGWKQEYSSTASDGSYAVFAGIRRLEEPTAIDPEQELRYEFTTDAGAYHLFMRLDAPDPSRNSVWVKVDQQPWMKFWRETTGSQLLTSGFEWRKVNHDGTSSSLELSAGTHTIRVANREAGTKIDKLLLSTTDSPPIDYGPDAANCAAIGTQSMTSAAQIQTVPSAQPGSGVAADAYLSVFPNPATDHISLELSSEYLGAVGLIVYDLHGRRIQEQVLQKDSIFLTTTLMIDTLPTGMYRLQVIQGDHSTARSFIRR